MYKAIFLDIDGTIKNDDGMITERTKNAIKSINEMGIKVILCSARNRDKTSEISKNCGASQYVIAYNGAEIYDYNRKESLYKATLDSKILTEISNLISNSKSESIITGETFGEKITDIQTVIDNEVIQSRIKLISQQDKLIEELKKISGISIYVLYRNEEKRIVNKKEATQIDYFIVKENTNKWEAIKMLCKSKKISIDDIISIGDGENDIEMIQNSGLGITLENAPEHIKRIADLVIPSNNDNGVAFFLEGLKEKIYDEERGER